MEYCRNLTDFFEEKLSDLSCQSDTRAYIVGVFVKYKNANFDLSKNSITLTFSEARQKQNFLTFQNVADFIFFSRTAFPSSLNDASPDYYQTIGRLSYYSCFKLINKQWRCYEELADRFISLEIETRKLLEQNYNNFKCL